MALYTNIGHAFWLALVIFGLITHATVGDGVLTLAPRRSSRAGDCGIDGKGCLRAEGIPSNNIVLPVPTRVGKGSLELGGKSPTDEIISRSKNRPVRTDAAEKLGWNSGSDYHPELMEKGQEQWSDAAAQSSFSEEEPYDPYSPLVRCNFLPLEFLECDEPEDLEGNQTAFDVNGGFGCYRYGGLRWEDVLTTSTYCTVLPGIECHGPERFKRDGVPCVKFTGHYFITTLLFSVLMGFFAVDRFCLGYTCIGIGKILTLGGFGVWWIVDIVLLVTGNLVPEDGSNWMPNY
ncbi:putative TM2 domain-containing protein [Hypsibius exemplaris]|uniref:TM2 domain-containing protein n=1 Tax=Hypsibius exemplaris TaxID=2072580 RepID=A0A1W0XAS1_HYPEX|nr:putative TM2 domain-containing protein [Hypsibius exemplaris]